MESHADVLTWFLRYIPYMKKKTVGDNKWV